MSSKRNYKTKRSRKKTASWRKFQLSSQFKRRLRIVGLALTVVISTVVVTAAVHLYFYFTSPMAEAAENGQQSIQWDKGRVNLLWLVHDDNVPIDSVLISLEPGSSDYTIVRLPSDVLPTIDVQVISNILAVPIDGYIETTSAGANELREITDGSSLIQSLPSLAMTAKAVLKSNLTLRELASVGKKIWEGKSETIEINSDELLAGGSIDNKIGTALWDSGVTVERLKVQVFNGTDQSGLAGGAARFATNLGTDVIYVGNMDRDGKDAVEKSVIVSKISSESRTIFRLSKALGISDLVNDYPGVGDRADITIITGLDLIK